MPIIYATDNEDGMTLPIEMEGRYPDRLVEDAGGGEKQHIETDGLRDSMDCFPQRYP